MKIWIDGYEANINQRLGSSQVAFELIKGLERIDHKNEYTILLPDSPKDFLPEERDGFRYKVLKPKKLWTRIALPLALFTTKKKPDIFFSPTHYIPRFCPSKIKRICTIFDLAFIHFPEMFISSDLWKLKNWTKFSVENSDHIITISNFSKKDIIKQYGIDKDKITVAYPGYDREKFKIRFSSENLRMQTNSKFKIEEAKKKYKTEDSYIIYIGTIQPRKNLIRLMEAFARINDQLNLIIVGKTVGEERGGWMYEDILQAPSKLGIKERVKFLGFLPTEDLPYLLSGSKSFILPSLWEGFGITVLEAMACGVPVIVSNVSSLPEIVGKAGLLVDPNSLDQIEQAIRTIFTDKKLSHNLIIEGLKQVQKFSWEKMAKTVLKTF